MQTLYYSRGQSYIIPSGTTDAWAGRDGMIAGEHGGASMYFEPQEG
ncbi:DUF2793 domain-containing protein [Henriciella sp.]